MIEFILRFILFFTVFWCGWLIGKEPKKAKWHQMEFWPNGGTWRCSNCARQVMFLDSNPEAERLYYCPHCGAKMDGKETNDG